MTHGNLDAAQGNAPSPAELNLVSLFFLGCTAFIFFICFRILAPFTPVIAWALAISVMGYPIYRIIRRRVHNESMASFISVTILTLAIVVPLSLLTHQVVQQIAANVSTLRSSLEDSTWLAQLQERPLFAPIFGWLEQNGAARLRFGDVLDRITATLPAIFTGSVWSLVQLLIILFTVFFFFRDKRSLLAHVRSLIPLPSREIDELFIKVADTIHATLYGSVVVAAIQGFLGGLVFWFLGLPAAAFWGSVMAVCSLIPYLGTSVVWIPAAIFLAVQRDFVSAIILVAWGSLVVGLIDNLLYPILVGRSLRYHPLPIFFFIIGGISLFGMSGLVLGPIMLALAEGCVEIWKRRLHPDTRG